MENIVLIGFELGIFNFISHLFLYLFPTEEAMHTLTERSLGKKPAILVSAGRSW